MTGILTDGYFLKIISSVNKNALKHARKLNARVSSSSSSKSDNPIKIYNTPHPPKDPPENYNPLCVDHDAFNVPDFIPAAVFRPFSSRTEKIGPGAGKDQVYKNPEYYSYHRYSFVALQVACIKVRHHRKKMAEIRLLYDYEDSDDEKYSSDEDKKS